MGLALRIEFNSHFSHGSGGPGAGRSQRGSATFAGTAKTGPLMIFFCTNFDFPFDLPPLVPRLMCVAARGSSILPTERQDGTRSIRLLAFARFTAARGAGKSVLSNRHQDRLVPLCSIDFSGASFLGAPKICQNIITSHSPGSVECAVLGCCPALPGCCLIEPALIRFSDLAAFMS